MKKWMDEWKELVKQFLIKQFTQYKEEAVRKPSTELPHPSAFFFVGGSSRSEELVASIRQVLLDNEFFCNTNLVTFEDLKRLEPVGCKI